MQTLVWTTSYVIDKLRQVSVNSFSKNMQSISQVLSSTEQYKRTFEDGMADILKYRTAGTFILACANIFQHSDLHEKYKKPLIDAYSHVEEYYLSCRSNQQQPNDSADDTSVMNKIIDIGFDKLAPIQSRQLGSNAGNFLLNFNQLRSFRPARMSKQKEIRLNTIFNEDGFHFDKAFLKKEMFAEGEHQGRQISLLYNKFPFVEYHALLVIDKSKHKNQYLTKEYLAYVIQLQSYTQKHIPEFVITYNSLGAGASVNHLHFQAFLETRPLAVFSHNFSHNGGPAHYPATCHVYTNSEDGWLHIQKLHEDNVPYNLLFKDGKIFCLPRSELHQILFGLDISTYGWAEMAGIFTVYDEEIFKNITIDQLIDSLKAVTFR